MSIDPERELKEAVSRTEDFVADLRKREVNKGVALGAALSIIYAHLLLEYPDSADASNVMSAAMHGACLSLQEAENEDEIH
jgi:hypothetical protein